MSDTPRTVEMRITDYLCSGGLFNPELANHDAVRDLLIDARDALTAERERAERLMERLQQESERCDKEISQRIWADDELQRERERADRLMRLAYLAGWNASGEGYNAEYPFGDNDKDPEADAKWVAARDAAIDAARGK